ncbi:MAG: hypothetical protein V2I43_02165 [Parvularcula sp.]|jgi:hypothetical protein|nr:hypothetical protein [Parvularcula sp.]
MPNINDQDYKEYLKEVSMTLLELAKELESYVEDEKSETIKQGNEELIRRALRMSDDMGDIILRIATR